MTKNSLMVLPKKEDFSLRSTQLVETKHPKILGKLKTKMMCANFSVYSKTSSSH